MKHSRSPDPAFTTAATAALLFGLAALGPAGCRDGRHAAEARVALGTQLGARPRAGGATGPGAQAASADDLVAARRYLEATLRLDPTNAAARAALAGLGPGPDVTLAFTDPARMPGPVASRARLGRRTISFTQVAFGELDALGADVAHAVEPWAPVPAAAPDVPRSASDSAEALAASLGARSAAADSAARGGSVRAESRVRTRSRATTATPDRRRATREAALAAREDSPAAADSTKAAVADTAAPQAGPSRKHKRTWPWTRAQRWLVAKGVVGGSGAGVVIGAIVGNVPGALIAGSLGGGAVGFKKATKIGPAAPYPTPRDSAADAEKRARERKENADTAATLAARP